MEALSQQALQHSKDNCFRDVLLMAGRLGIDASLRPGLIRLATPGVVEGLIAATSNSCACDRAVTDNPIAADARLVEIR